MDLPFPRRCWSRTEVLATGCPVAEHSGVYAWFFDEIPPGVPTTDCLHRDGLTLLYIGISPKEPPKNGSRPSRQTLRQRIRYHYRGNAYGSTLRLTLGVLLGLELRRVGRGSRLTFAEQEAALSDWMADHARVTWLEHERPWELETQLLRSFSLPLNLDQNRHHAFRKTLSGLRTAAKARARAMPVSGGENAHIEWVKVEDIGRKGHGIEFTHVALPDTILAFIDGFDWRDDEPTTRVEILRLFPRCLPPDAWAQLKSAVIQRLCSFEQPVVGCPDIEERING